MDALLLAANRGRFGESYCVGGHGERTNKEVVEMICEILDRVKPGDKQHSCLITPVKDRPGHDRRYAIDPTKIFEELGWSPRHSIDSGLETTVRWFLDHHPWCAATRQKAGYEGGRLGVINTQ